MQTGQDNTYRKSTSGHLFFCGSGAVSWSSRKQESVAVSTTEAEYVSTAEACKQLNWILQLMQDFGIEEPKPVQLFEDNEGCIRLALTEKINSRTKHIDVKHHLVRNMTKEGLVELEHCRTDEMIADSLTKPLPRDKFESLCKKMNLVDFVH